MRVPEEGAVLRCEPDGSRLEVYCRGLRDVHGLAFDDAGNLFTGDDGSGKDDGGRWLPLVEHGDYGWRSGWLHSALGPAGTPWIAEKLWAARFDGQAAWMLPPAFNVAAGSWGLAHYPGTGFVTRYDDHFFVCNPARRSILCLARETEWRGIPAPGSSRSGRRGGGAGGGLWTGQHAVFHGARRRRGNEKRTRTVHPCAPPGGLARSAGRGRAASCSREA